MHFRNERYVFITDELAELGHLVPERAGVRGRREGPPGRAPRRGSERRRRRRAAGRRPPETKLGC